MKGSKMINDRINLTVENHIAHVQFSRPDKMNALDPKMFEAIPMVGEQLRSDSGIRVVVVSGDGGNFCAGLDMSNFTALLNKAEQSGGAGDKLLWVLICGLLTQKAVFQF